VERRDEPAVAGTSSLWYAPCRLDRLGPADGLRRRSRLPQTVRSVELGGLSRSRGRRVSGRWSGGPARRSPGISARGPPDL